ncbi:ABC transporter substrate-binding protein [Microbacterium trichothecenolyticum]|uniref:Thiamine pyrimidine synthase n=1 Tax=Microbacterium trichothecenolyticum TaxID=69370 RepID=A0ABU0TX26_MICTR|nr:ABC transporter substrate-binding protein [Microbacterium trichothecenolyticum]MDQ1124065.1 putative hydroxymethylpyrimidine transport system substrate-binding protein [Microbacterium trichothecenolyticum]
MSTAARHIRRVVAAACGVALAVTLTACAGGSGEASGDGGTTDIRFIQEWPVADGFWIPWLVAKDQGFYEEAGLNVDIMTPPNTSATMQYLGTQQADLAFTTSVDIVTARSQGVPVVGIGTYGTNNNWGLMTTSGEPIKPDELSGKLIGTYNDAWSNAQLSIMLGSVGKTINDVTLVTADSSTVPLLVDGKVDAITGITNAEGSELQSLGKDYSISYSKDYGAPDAPVLMLAGNSQWLDEHPDAASAFMTATIRGLNWARQNPDKAVDIFMAAYPDAQSLDFTTLQWEATSALFGDAGVEVTADDLKQSPETWQSLVDVAVTYGLIDQSIPVSDLYTNSALGE